MKRHWLRFATFDAAGKLIYVFNTRKAALGSARDMKLIGTSFAKPIRVSAVVVRLV